MQTKLTKIAENSVALRDKCVKHHYAAALQGSGTGRLRIPCGFQPDLLTVICTDPRLMGNNYAVAFFSGDLSGLGLAAATASGVRGGNLFNIAMTTTTVMTRVAWDGEGCTLTNLKDGDTECTFPTELPYYAVAVKLHEQTLKERFTAFVEGLTGSGTAQVCKVKIQEVFTESEWAALKATRPDWTFKEV